MLDLDLHLDCGHTVTVNIPVTWGPPRGTQVALSAELDTAAVRRQIDAHRAACQ